MRIVITLLAFSIAFGSFLIRADKSTTHVVARCTGSSPCNACSNCSSCGWCSGGGTCGVCAKKSTTPKPKRYSSPATSSGQCKAKTKKGTRCSRNSRSGGYCWQHGG